MKPTLLSLMTISLTFTAAMAGETGPASVAPAGDNGQPPYSWRGINGSGVFPAQGLVTSFKGDAEGKGPNIVWRTALPNWGGNAPIVVKDKVFVLCQEGVDIQCPQLLCLDVNTGKILWQKPVDHLDAWPFDSAQGGPADKAKVAKETRAKHLRYWREYMTWWNKLYWDNEKSTWKKGVAHPKGKPPEVIPPEQAALAAEAAKAGYNLPPTWGLGVSGGWRGRYYWGSGTEEMQQTYAACANNRYHWYSGWTSEGPFFGSCMGSVVSDGNRIYAVTALDGAACFDLDGKRLWVADLEGKQILNLPASASHIHNSMTSPVLARDKLMYYHYGAVEFIALDAQTGRLAWRTPGPIKAGKRRFLQVAGTPIGYGGHMAPGGTPVVMELGNTTVVVSGHGMAVRVADGKFLGMVSVPNTNETGSDSADEPPSLDETEDAVSTNRNADAEVFGSTYCSWVADKDVIFAASDKRGIGAVRLRLDGDKLVSEPIWVEKGLNNMEGPNLAVFAGRLYGVSVKERGFAEINPATGRIDTTTTGPAGWCTGWVISRDGVAVYKGGKKGFLICQLPGMKPLGEGALDDTPTPEQRERNIAQLGFAVANGGPAGITAFGNRIFYRTNHYLWCVGKPAEPWRAPEACTK